MDKEMLEQFQLITKAMADMEFRLEDKIMASERRLEEKIRESEARTKLFIENTVTERIKGLFDGYQSALENQALLKVANETMARELDDIKDRLTALESKTA